MADCEKQLWELVRTIEPTRTQKFGAARSHKYLRDILCTGQMAARISKSYLSGSYKRGTAIYPLDDVDIIFVIDPSQWRRPFSLARTILFGSSTYPPPASVLESFANAIRYRYRDSSVHRQRRSVCLRLYHLDIDVVPAIQDGKDPKRIRIPDRGATEWIVSSPLEHSENATRANKFQDGKFKPLVKLLKHWNGHLPSTATFRSFAIETMAVRIFQTLKFDTLQEGLRAFFDFVAYASNHRAVLRWKGSYGMSLNWFKCSIPDAAGTGGNIVGGVDGERRKRFVEHAIRSRDKMVESFKAASSETAWRRVSEALKV